MCSTREYIVGARCPDGPMPWGFDPVPEVALAAREAYDSLRGGDAVCALGLLSTLKQVIADARRAQDEEFDLFVRAAGEAPAPGHSDDGGGSS